MVVIGISAIEVNDGNIGVEPDRLGKIINRFVDGTVYAIGVSATHVGGDIVWVESDSLG